jgi:hypothetical protein
MNKNNNTPDFSTEIKDLNLISPSKSKEDADNSLHSEISTNLNNTTMMVEGIYNAMNTDTQNFRDTLYKNEAAFDDVLNLINGSAFKAKRAKKIIEMSMDVKYQAFKEKKMQKEDFIKYVEATNQMYIDKGATAEIFNVNNILDS